MRGRSLVAMTLLCTGLTSAAARPVFMLGGSPGPASAPTEDCGTGGVCAKHQNGQTFVTWDDVGTDGAGGASTRYRLYRSTAPIDSGNYASATLIASYIFNNSAQLFGGNPDVDGTAFNQTARQSAGQPMSKLTDLGTALPTFSGLQVYTALASQNAYYAVVSTNTSDGSPSFMGAVGPIAESVADPKPVKYAASGSRADNSYGQLSSPAGKPVIYSAHASQASGGAPPGSRYGDYWQWWLPTDAGWQDGRATTLAVRQDNAQNVPSLPSVILVSSRDTIWTPDASGAMETFHQGIGMTPNPLVGPANRMYLTTAKGISRMLSWAIDHYGLDGNAVHWTGQSMGAWGGANTGMRMTSPRFASVWLTRPCWRMDFRNSAGWPGNTWGSYPFRATVGSPPSTLGTVASAVQLDDGTTWGGTGGYADMPGFIASNPGNDLPFAAWEITKNDGFCSWAQQLSGLAAFQTGKRGHAFVWYMGAHDGTGGGAINCDITGDSTACYGKSLFGLTTPYIAFTNSSIDDDPGDGGTLSNGLFNGDFVGCVNCGFKWNVTTDNASAFNFTVDNVWMDRSPTTIPSTTLTASIPSSGGGTVTVTDGSVFLSVLAGNNYFLVDDEVIVVTSRSGNTLTYTSRAQLGTAAAAHSSGATITQFPNRPTGPNGGPYSTMTVDVTPRRIQGFTKGTTNGQVITCDITPNGGSTTQQTPTVADNIFTLTGVTINASGVTSIACS